MQGTYNNGMGVPQSSNNYLIMMGPSAAAAGTGSRLGVKAGMPAGGSFMEDSNATESNSTSMRNI